MFTEGKLKHTSRKERRKRGGEKEEGRRGRRELVEVCGINMAFWGTQMLDGGWGAGGRGGARLTNLGPQAKSSPLPVFVNEVLLEGHVHPFTHYLWLILWYS